MTTVSLDDVQAEFPVDFLSLDTQGSEFEILSGTPTALANAIGIETEVSFRQIYEGSVLFGDLCSFRNRVGFEFVCFTHLVVAAPRAMPLVGRARKLHTFGDALFLRSADTVSEAVQQRKLIFAALAYGQVEHAASCVRRFHSAVAGEHPLCAAPRAVSELKTWSDFVEVFISIVLTMNDSQLPRDLADVITVEESLKRFEPGVAANTNPSANSARRCVRALPPGLQRGLAKLRNIDLVASYFAGPPSDQRLSTKPPASLQSRNSFRSRVSESCSRSRSLKLRICRYPDTMLQTPAKPYQEAGKGC